jgi:hypothetical protein
MLTNKGLYNISGSDCYINAALQLLFNIAPLCRALINVTTKHPAARQLSRIMAMMEVSTVRHDIYADALQHVRDQVQQLSKTTGQGDSSECLLALFAIIGHAGISLDCLATQLQHRCICPHCGTVSPMGVAKTFTIVHTGTHNSVFETLMTLTHDSVNVPGSDYVHGFDKDSQNEQVKCDKGHVIYANEQHTHVQSWSVGPNDKTTHIIVYTGLLTVDANGQRIKRTRAVFPDSQLNLGGIYQLVGYIMHIGATQSGHYVWRQFQDTMCTRGQEYSDSSVGTFQEDGAKHFAHMLLYARVNMA